MSRDANKIIIAVTDFEVQVRLKKKFDLEKNDMNFYLLSIFCTEKVTS